MNEQDKKLLELYEKDIKKKKIFFCFVAIMFIIVISFYLISLTVCWLPEAGF